MSPKLFISKIFSLPAIALASAIALQSCAPSATSDSASEAESAGLQVVTTFLPITQFTRAVAGDRAEVQQLLPSNVSPHDYQAKPTDVQAIAKADVVVQNGLEFEFFLEDMIENADNTDLVLIDSSDEVETIEFSESEEEHSEDKHDDHAGHDDHGEAKHDDHEDHDDEEKHDDHDDHGEEKAGQAVADGHDHHHHGDVDPHIWLDPKRAIEQVENIRDGLITADPAGEAEYTANAAAYIEELQALDQEITEQLAPYQGQTFISFHDFAAYFADSYSLDAEFLVDVPEANPTPDDVKRVIETTQAAKLKALLTEPQGEGAFEALAQDLDIGIAVFDPLETGAMAEPEGYLSTMRQNLKNLKTAFTDHN